MLNTEDWTWEVGKKTVADLAKWEQEYSYIEEPYASYDGESVSAVVRNEEMEFTICTQAGDDSIQCWENTYDKIWNLKYGPDDRLSAFVSDMAEWTVSTDDQPWENTCEFVWKMTMANNGRDIAVCSQSELQCGVLVNDNPWEKTFSRLNSMVLSPDGKRAAAIVETEPVLEGEIFKFRKGCYSVAVDGKPWDKSFMNVWDPCFSSDCQHTAATVRHNYYEYSIAVDGKPWDKSYGSVWEPRFSPVDSSVTAPVKQGGGMVPGQRRGHFLGQGVYPALASFLHRGRKYDRGHYSAGIRQMDFCRGQYPVDINL